MSSKYYTGRATGITDWPEPDPSAVLAKQTSEKRAVALLDLVIAIHNKAIEEAARVAEDARGIEHRHIIAEEIRKLKRAP